MTCAAALLETEKMAHLSPVGRHQGGIAYLALLIAMAVLGMTLAVAGTVWETTSRRDKEDELLFVGLQFQRAIQQYYESSPGEKRYPRSLDDLILDTRYPNPRRYLRMIYVDPITRNPRWGLLRSPDGGIMGVFSTAAGSPIKRSGFPVALQSLEAKATYKEWEFAYFP